MAYNYLQWILNNQIFQQQKQVWEVRVQNVVHQDVNKNHLVTGVMNTPTITICGVSIAVEKAMRNQKKKQNSNNIFKIAEVEKQKKWRREREEEKRRKQRQEEDEAREKAEYERRQQEQWNQQKQWNFM